MNASLVFTVIGSAALIACAFLLGHWHRGWTQRKELIAADLQGYRDGFNDGRASYAREMDARRNAVHALGRTQIARTVVLSRQKTGATP